jgi:hypothetical protein
VYRITGCGMVASYQCTEGANLSTRCQQLYVSKVEDEQGAPKSAETSSMAKAN